MKGQSFELQQDHARLHWAHAGVSGLTCGEASCGAGCGAGVAAVICLRFLSGRLCTVRQAGFAGCEGPSPSSVGEGGGRSGIGGASCFPTVKPNINFIKAKQKSPYLWCPIWSELAPCTVFGLDAHQLGNLAEEYGRQIPVRGLPGHAQLTIGGLSFRP